MKKKLLPIAIGLISAFFMVSCESEQPFSGGSSTNVINTWIYDEIFTPNYLWEVSSSPDKSLEPVAFFNSLKNSNDKVSQIWKIADVSASYDIGFEYAANKYNDGKIYYVIYYVKPNTSAATQGLKRGYIITAVNGTEPASETEAETLLENAYQSGADVNLTYVVPPASDPETITVSPRVLSAENPLFTSTIIDNRGAGNKVGYILYNSFTSGTQDGDYSYDNALASKLQEFMTAEIDYLVLDLRYNAGGNVRTSEVLASAIVKDRVASENYIIFKREREGVKETEPVILRDNTRGNTAIPKLGDRLKRVYIITGAYTAGVSEAFINALWAYRTDVTIVGEKTAGAGTISTGSSRSTDGVWGISIAIGHMASKNGYYDYANGITPDPIVYEVSKDQAELLNALGNEEETVLATVLSLISGNNTSSIKTVNTGASSRPISSSITNKPWANKSIVDLN